MREYAVIDVETTGLSPSTGRIIEIGMLRMSESGEVLDSYETLVDPQGPVGAVHIHGITPDMVQDAPTFRRIAGDILKMLREAVLVAHNIPFDKGFLLSEFSRAGVIILDMPSLCTLKLSRRFYPRLSSKSLSSMCTHLGIGLDWAHRALDDCRAAASLLFHLKRIGPVDQYISGEEPSRWPDIPPSGMVVKRPD